MVVWANRVGEVGFRFLGYSSGAFRIKVGRSYGSQRSYYTLSVPGTSVLLHVPPADIPYPLLGLAYKESFQTSLKLLGLVLLAAWDPSRFQVACLPKHCSFFHGFVLCL